MSYLHSSEELVIVKTPWFGMSMKRAGAALPASSVVLSNGLPTLPKWVETDQLKLFAPLRQHSNVGFRVRFLRCMYFASGSCEASQKDRGSSPEQIQAWKNAQARCAVATSVVQTSGLCEASDMHVNTPLQLQTRLVRVG